MQVPSWSLERSTKYDLSPAEPYTGRFDASAPGMINVAGISKDNVTLTNGFKIQVGDGESWGFSVDIRASYNTLSTQLPKTASAAQRRFTARLLLVY